MLVGICQDWLRLLKLRLKEGFWKARKWVRGALNNDWALRRMARLPMLYPNRYVMYKYRYMLFEVAVRCCVESLLKKYRGQVRSLEVAELCKIVGNCSWAPEPGSLEVRTTVCRALQWCEAMKMVRLKNACTTIEFRE